MQTELWVALVRRLGPIPGVGLLEIIGGGRLLTSQLGCYMLLSGCYEEVTWLLRRLRLGCYLGQATARRSPLRRLRDAHWSRPSGLARALSEASDSRKERKTLKFPVGSKQSASALIKSKTKSKEKKVTSLRLIPTMTFRCD